MFHGKPGGSFLPVFFKGPEISEKQQGNLQLGQNKSHFHLKHIMKHKSLINGFIFQKFFSSSSLSKNPRKTPQEKTQENPYFTLNY